MTFIVAASQYPVEPLADWASYAEKLESWLAEAAGQGAALAIFPEYGAMELAALDPATMGDLAGSLAFVASLMPQIDRLHAELAARHNLHILAASGPFRRDDASYVNRARLFTPGGKAGIQDKQIMTRFEHEIWGVSAGAPLRVFNTALGRMGVLVCYDCEFPLLARAQIEAGAQLLLVPSCTDTLHGYWRVRTGAQARALEGQCYVVQSPLVGEAPWSPAIDVNRGAAGIYGPPDAGFPEDGVLQHGEIDKPQWVLAEIDLAKLQDLRTNGSVLNLRDWAEQPAATALPPVELIALD